MVLIEKFSSCLADSEKQVFFPAPGEEDEVGLLDLLTPPGDLLILSKACIPRLTCGFWYAKVCAGYGVCIVVFRSLFGLHAIRRLKMLFGLLWFSDGNGIITGVGHFFQNSFLQLFGKTVKNDTKSKALSKWLASLNVRSSELYKVPSLGCDDKHFSYPPMMSRTSVSRYYKDWWNFNDAMYIHSTSR